jgi:hypothetical protein
MMIIALAVAEDDIVRGANNLNKMTEGGAARGR